jgi:hypothetical protein
MWNEPPEVGSRYVSRQGHMVKADAAFDAWTSRDVARMVAALDVPTNPIDRHHLLQTLVAETFCLRTSPEMRRICRNAGELHIAEFPTIAPALVRDLGLMPRVRTFALLATLLAEEGEYDYAIEVCQRAQSHALDDGTKGGYAGRIARIERRRG